VRALCTTRAMACKPGTNVNGSADYTDTQTGQPLWLQSGLQQPHPIRGKSSALGVATLGEV